MHNAHTLLAHRLGCHIAPIYSYRPTLWKLYSGT